MLIDFNALPAHAKVWLYYIPRQLTESEIVLVTNTLTAFCMQWIAHGTPLQTSFRLLHEKFIVLAVDEDVHNASGCSIDGSVKIIRELGEKLQIDFFNRQFVAYWHADRLEVVPVLTFKMMNIAPDTFVLDQTVATIGELTQRTRINISETWLNRYTQVLA